MENPLTGLPPRALLDSNIILDGAFVAAGYARRAIEGLRDLGFMPVIDAAIERESREVLIKLRRRLGLSFDPEATLARFLSSRSVLTLPRGDIALGSGVHRSDAHVASAARQYNAWVITGDVILARECIESGIPVRLAWDVVSAATYASGPASESLARILRIAPPGADRGVIFARVTPGAWAGMEIEEQFTVCEIEHVGAMFYRARRGQWVFETKLGATAVLHAPIARGGKTWAVCASYSLPASLEKGNITIRAADSPAKAACHSSQRPRTRLASTGPGKITFGRRIDGTGYWNGHVRCIVIGPHTVSASTWRALVTVPEGAPNPFDADALERVLKLAEAAIRSPAFNQVRVIPN